MEAFDNAVISNNFGTQLVPKFWKFMYILENDILTSVEKNRFKKLMDGVDTVPRSKRKDGAENPSYVSFIRRLKGALMNLSVWMERYWKKKVIILIDEYDTPLQAAYLNGYWNDAVNLIGAFFEMTFKCNPSLDRAIIMGITRIGEKSLFSFPNHMNMVSVLSKRYGKGFGFTQSEVDDALKEYGLFSFRSEVKKWYDGFVFGDTFDIYNPWSICNYLKAGDAYPVSYWAQSGGMGLIDHLIRNGNYSVLDDLNQLILGGTILCSVTDTLTYTDLLLSRRAFWSLLLSTGYIRPAREEEMTGVFFQKEEENHEMAVCLTNREMQESFTEMAQKWLLGEETDAEKPFLDALKAKDLNKMNQYLQTLVDACVSTFDTGRKPAAGNSDRQPERYFQGLMVGLLSSLLGAYEITAQGKSGDGRYDVSLKAKAPRRELFLLEFKVFDERQDHSLEDTANRARAQIDEKRYDARFLAEGYSKDEIARYGIGFKGKKVLIVS